MEIATNLKTVVDPATKLEWKCAVEGKYAFDDAVEKFGKVDAAGFRLPTIDELKTLIGTNEYVTEALELNDNFFWSSSPYGGFAPYAWFVSFFTDKIYNGYTSGVYHVRLVRACR